MPKFKLGDVIYKGSNTVGATVARTGLGGDDETSEVVWFDPHGESHTDIILDEKWEVRKPMSDVNREITGTMFAAFLKNCDIGKVTDWKSMYHASIAMRFAVEAFLSEAKVLPQPDPSALHIHYHVPEGYELHSEGAVVQIKPVVNVQHIETDERYRSRLKTVCLDRDTHFVDKVSGIDLDAIGVRCGVKRGNFK